MVTTRTLIDFIGQNGAFERIVKNEISEILETRVSEVMSHIAATVERNEDLTTAINLMVSTKEGTVCVIEGEKLAGILTERDVARSIAL
jgi:predicted transcriptional regulator